MMLSDSRSFSGYGTFKPISLAQHDELLEPILEISDDKPDMSIYNMCAKEKAKCLLQELVGLKQFKITEMVVRRDPEITMIKYFTVRGENPMWRDFLFVRNWQSGQKPQED
jgi:hypothetical protein